MSDRPDKPGNWIHDSGDAVSMRRVYPDCEPSRLACFRGEREVETSFLPMGGWRLTDPLDEAKRALGDFIEVAEGHGLSVEPTTVLADWFDERLDELDRLKGELHRIRQSPGLTAEQTPSDDGALLIVALAERDAARLGLAERDAEIATLNRKVELYRRHDLGGLFCWCVEHLDKFPPIEGEWQDEVKRRLSESQARGGG